jgi:uncharacterized protein (UPF0254 family)
MSFFSAGWEATTIGYTAKKFLLIPQGVPVHSCAQFTSLGSTFIPDVSGGRALLDVANPSGRNVGLTFGL